MPVCPECGKELKTNIGLQGHRQTHFKPKQREAPASEPSEQGDFTDFFYRTDDKRGYDLKKTFHCPRCGSKMLYHFSGVNKPRVGEGWVLGITLKCLRCTKVEHYGPPLDEEYKNKILEMRAGKTSTSLGQTISPLHRGGGEGDKEETGEDGVFLKLHRAWK